MVGDTLATFKSDSYVYLFIHFQPNNIAYFRQFNSYVKYSPKYQSTQNTYKETCGFCSLSLPHICLKPVHEHVALL
jgi:hypothetical protein